MEPPWMRLSSVVDAGGAARSMPHCARAPLRSPFARAALSVRACRAAPALPRVLLGLLLGAAAARRAECRSVAPPMPRGVCASGALLPHSDGLVRRHSALRQHGAVVLSFCHVWSRAFTPSPPSSVTSRCLLLLAGSAAAPPHALHQQGSAPRCGHAPSLSHGRVCWLLFALCIVAHTTRRRAEKKA